MSTMIHSTLYHCDADDRVVDKSNYLDTGRDVFGVVDIGFDPSDPQIRVEYTPAPGDPLLNPSYNYVYIAELGRYFFAKKYAEWQGGKAWIYDLHVDVLYSFKDDILALNAYVDRAESLYDNMIQDPLTPAKTGGHKIMSTGEFVEGKGSRDNADYIYVDPYADANDDTSDPRVSINFAGSVYKIPNDATEYYNSTGYLQLYCKKDEYARLAIVGRAYQMSRVKAYTNLPQYLSALSSGRVTPYRPKTDATYQQLDAAVSSLGMYAFFGEVIPDERIDFTAAPLNANNVYAVRDQKITYYWKASITISGQFYHAGDLYYNYPPYRQWMIKMQPLGVVEIDPSYMSITTGTGSYTVTVYIRADVDAHTGKAYFYYGSSKASANVAMGSTVLSVDLPLMQATDTQSGIDLATGVVTGIADAGAQKSISPAIANIGKIESYDDIKMPTMSGVPGCKIFDVVPELWGYEKESVEIEKSLYGKPLRQYIALSLLHGYVKVDDCKIGIAGASQDERDEIKRLLQLGVFLPEATP